MFELFMHVYSSNALSARFLPRCLRYRGGLAMRILSVRLSVRSSVLPSVKRVICDKTEERSVQIFYIIRKII